MRDHHITEDVVIPYRLAARETVVEARRALWLATAWDAVHFPLARRHLHLQVDGHCPLGPASSPPGGGEWGVALVPPRFDEDVYQLCDWVHSTLLRHLTSARFPLLPGGQRLWNRFGQDDALAIPGTLERLLALEDGDHSSQPSGTSGAAADQDPTHPTTIPTGCRSQHPSRSA